jgi:hypothetical protein
MSRLEAVCILSGSFTCRTARGEVYSALRQIGESAVRRALSIARWVGSEGDPQK